MAAVLESALDPRSALLRAAPAQLNLSLCGGDCSLVASLVFKTSDAS